MKLKFKTIQKAMTHAIESQVSKKTQRTYTIEQSVDIDTIHAIIENCNNDSKKRAKCLIQFDSWRSNLGVLTIYLVPKTLEN